MSPPSEGHKRLTSTLCVFFLGLSLAHYDAANTLLGDTLWRGHVTRHQGGLPASNSWGTEAPSTRANKEPNPTNSHMSELESRSFPVEP